jgi:hypothetical protein
MIRYKRYPTTRLYPYYKFDLWVYINNNILLKPLIWWDTYFVYGIYGYLKFWLFSLLVFLKIREPFEEWEIPEYYFDLDL